ncbi:MAG: response regulator transcription factor [Acidobacteriaceae bacterium]
MGAGFKPEKAQNSRTRLRVGLVAADPLRVLGFQSIFEAHPRVEIVSGPMEEVLRDQTLDVALLGAQASDHLFELLATFKSFRPRLRIIVIGLNTDFDHIQRVIGAGAKGYLAETASEKDILMAIEVVEDGSVWAPRKVLSRLLEHVGEASGLQVPMQHSEFTPREREVLELLVAGRSNREIARSLKIEERTVKSHVGKLLRKVGVPNRIALSVHALTHDLLGRSSRNREE